MSLMFLDLFFDTRVVLDVISSALSAPWHLMLPKNENENLIQWFSSFVFHIKQPLK
jgi:hypothetical protein